MPIPQPPSAIWDLEVDAPIVQDASYSFTDVDRSYIDSQAVGSETHLVNSLIGGTICTWRTLDPTSAAGAVGNVVCLSGLATGTVTLATTAALLNAGKAFGVLMTAGAPGANVRIAVAGMVPQSVTGLAAGPAYAQVSSTGTNITSTALPSSSGYLLGAIDAAGNLALAITPPQAPPNTATTTNTTPTVVYTYTMPANPSVARLDVVYQARDVTTIANSGCGQVRGLFSNASGTAAQIGSTQSIGIVGSTAVTFAVTGATVQVKITGLTTDTINWVLSVTAGTA